MKFVPGLDEHFGRLLSLTARHSDRARSWYSPFATEARETRGSLGSADRLNTRPSTSKDQDV